MPSLTVWSSLFSLRSMWCLSYSSHSAIPHRLLRQHMNTIIVKVNVSRTSSLPPTIIMIIIMMIIKCKPSQLSLQDHQMITTMVYNLRYCFIFSLNKLAMVRYRLRRCILCRFVFNPMFEIWFRRWWSVVC